MADEMIPIVMFVSMAVAFLGWIYFRYRARMEAQLTFRAAIEKGTDLGPEFLKLLGDEQQPNRVRDLRRALIWLAIAVGLVLIGFAVPEPEAMSGLLAGAALPFTIGCAYLIMFGIGAKRES
ncbi:MAG: DUF6249 domain-containing protein [Gammaproteobacteria bacterium]|nr:DUF6249 domain-containing protein [Gammaproteobacteria bacterium]MDH5344434.1 DUF6249 domain-containing protein [Gammaproteobacteria bacterium]